MAPEGCVDKTIVYLTDNCLDEKLARVCRDWLVRNSNGMRIVSVSQEPMDFGFNVCVGKMPRTGMSIDLAVYEGAKHVETKWMMVAEHDCIYSKEHIAYIPSKDDLFYYNDNNWLLQYHSPNHPQYDGIFSLVEGRRVQSQLVCTTEMFRKAMQDKLEITADPEWSALYPAGRIAEPGACKWLKTIRIARLAPRRFFPKVLHYLNEYKGVDFITEEPNIDIRHGNNFTGGRRGTDRTYSLPGWGTMQDVLNA